MTATSSDIQVSPLFYATMNSTARRVVHQGGQWSGKTVNILIALATRALQQPGIIVTVTAESMPHLRGGALRDFERYVYPHFEPKIRQYNKADYIFYFNNGSLIEFKSFDDEFKARGAKRHYLFINEANRFDYLTFFQLDSRTDIQTIIDYNPTVAFWAHDHLIGQPGVDTFYSDHRHNPFLTDDKHKEIENIRDPELWKVYARGMTGNVQGVIYPDWKMIPDADFPKEAKFCGGLDWGYTSDPTAAVKIARIGDNIYLHELCYTPGLAPIEIKQLFIGAGFTNEAIYCDHAPEMIAQLRRIHVPAFPARKGAGSINAGILFMKQFKVHYTASSKNIAMERERYIWKQDPDTGKPSNTPIDNFNHILDAVRYGCFTQYFRS